MKRSKVIAVTGCPTCKVGIGEWCIRKGEQSPSCHITRNRRAIDGKPYTPPPKIYLEYAKEPAPDFYQSWAWKNLRYDALKKHGRKCQCCGWSPGNGAGYLVVDHIKPRRHFPELELNIENLQVLCNDCNMGKGAKHRDDFR